MKPVNVIPVALLVLIWAGIISRCVTGAPDAPEPPDFTCDFNDPGLCGLTASNANDFSWVRTQTGEGDVFDRPTSDKTGNNGYFLYAKEYLPKTILVSPLHDWPLKTGCLHFTTFMSAGAAGTLRVHVVPEGSSGPGDKILVWSSERNWAPAPVRHQVSIDTIGPLRVEWEFEGKLEPGVGTLQLDNILLRPLACGSNPGSCNFDKDLCDFTDLTMTFSRRMDETLTPNTGPTKAANADSRNIALNKPVVQSGGQPSAYYPQGVTDGLVNLPFMMGCTQTDSGSAADRWIKIDLLHDHVVVSFKITNRADCCGDALKNYDVYVDSGVTHKSLCKFMMVAVQTGATSTGFCDNPMVGRYVTLSLANTPDPLHICEMEVFGYDEKYIYHEASGPSQGDISLLSSGTLDWGLEAACLSLEYTNGGSGFGSMRIFTGDPSNETLEFETLLEKSLPAAFNSWTSAQLTFNASRPLKIYFKVIQGETDEGDVAFDEIVAIPAACGSDAPSSPIDCEFNLDNCNFTQSELHDADWTTKICSLALPPNTDPDLLVNAAIGRTVTLSTIDNTRGSESNAVDSDISAASCVHSKPFVTQDLWLRVDLGCLFEIHSVKIQNVHGCCGEELRNFDILVARELDDPLSKHQVSEELCVHHTPKVATSALIELKCTRPLTGRYVTLVLPDGADGLHICEIEVWAKQTGDGVVQFDTGIRVASTASDQIGGVNTPAFPWTPGPVCLRFWYHMEGPNVGQFEVLKRNDNTSVWTSLISKTGHQGQGWMHEETDIEWQPDTQLKFQATRSLDGEQRMKANIGLDDVTLTRDLCGNVPFQEEWEFRCDRPTTPCVSPHGSCNDTTYACDCVSGRDGLRCQLESARIPCSNPSFCQTGECYQSPSGPVCACPVGFYGDKCEHPAVQARCTQNKMTVNIHPEGYDMATMPMFRAPESVQTACKLLPVATFNQQHPQFASEGWKGFAQQFDLENDPCAGSATLIDDQGGNKTYLRQFYVYYNSQGRHVTDTIVNVTCSPPPLPPPQISTKIREIGAHTVKVRLADGRTVDAVSSHLEILFSLTFPNNRGFTELQVEACTVSNGVKSFQIVNGRCTVPPIGMFLYDGATPHEEFLVVKTYKKPGTQLKLHFHCDIFLCDFVHDRNCYTQRPMCFRRKRRSVRATSIKKKAGTIGFDFNYIE